ncbi:MAG: co-chaperone GroES [Deltaproteobacteria bacterium]|nr:MAG: co-chaperone GroES [Deltaproteobacteria bacterium]
MTLDPNLSGKQLIVIGDRVLLKVDDSERRTEVGLYLPDTVRDKEEVLGGTITQVGQGTPLVEPSLLADAMWKSSKEVSVRYIPMEARVGDYALFLKKAAVELEFENENLHIVPQSAILVLVREEAEEGDELV